MDRTQQDKQNTDEYITALRPNDVLVGRGSGPNDHEGNIRFRNLVSQRRAEYLATNHRQTKMKIAKEIVDTVLINNGRFLKRAADPKGAGVPPDVEAWCRVDDETTMEKVKQALRQSRAKPSKEEIDAAARKISIREVAAKVETETDAQQKQHHANKGGNRGHDDPYAPLPLDTQEGQQQQHPEMSQQQKLLLLQQQQYQILQQQEQEQNLQRQRQLEIAQQTPEIQQVYNNHYGNNNSNSASNQQQRPQQFNIIH